MASFFGGPWQFHIPKNKTTKQLPEVYTGATYPNLEHSPRMLRDFLEHSSSLRAYAHGVD